jgi:para-nitrobenzyl esterase
MSPGVIVDDDSPSSDLTACAFHRQQERSMATPTPVVETQSGALTGIYNKQGDIAIFKGVPYAQPPVGPLRWKPPQPPIPWTGTLKAEKASAQAIQQEADFEEFMDLFVEGQGWGGFKTAIVKLLLKVVPAPKQSEDCLYLTVRTPSLDEEAKLPVMVWIHGGDHQDGSANDIFYDSNALSRRGVVTVYMNYRLGLMGYFAHPELSRESEHGVSGNYGTLDQIAALRWVQENISAFGGNPDDVTIFGESAGGESVVHMLTSPLARGLFHKAIMESPANSGQMMFLRHPYFVHPAGEDLGQTFADRFAPAGEGQLEALRQIAPDRFYQLIRQEREFQHFYPVIDGYVLEKSPFEAFLNGEQARVPLLLGNNANEGTLLYPILHGPVPGYEDIPADRVAGLIQEEYREDAEAIMELYPGLRQGAEPAQIDFFGDGVFGAAVHFYALSAAKAGQPVYLYHFTRTPPSPKQTAGAYHASELPYVHGKPIPMFDFTEADEVLTRVMGDYWVQFAKSGDPNLSPHSEWLPFTVDNQRQMRLGLGSELGMTEIDRLAKYELIQKRLLRLIEGMKELIHRQPESIPA